MTNSTIGMLHILAAILALTTGFYVLVTQKGTLRHMRIGYVYTFAMLAVNITAFFIYRLYGKFAIFHWLAVFSLLTLAAGMYPVISKRFKNYLLLHFKFMYWSVIGLYCALMAETFSRLPTIVRTETGQPNTVFYQFVGIGTALVMVIGVFFFIKNKPKWTRQYSRT